LGSCAGFIRPQSWAEEPQKAQTYAGKKIRILIGPFTGSDRSVKEYSPGKVTTSVSNDGLEVQDAIKRD
jgi:transcription antitermination factor NusG